MRRIMCVWGTMVLLFVCAILLFGLAGCDGDKGPTPNPAEVYVDATSADEFSPKEILVDKGTIVTWTNTDADPHTVLADHLNPIGMGPNSDASLPNGIEPGKKFAWIVPEGVASGTKWYYHCRFHGSAGDGHSYGAGMAGLIVVK